jgi:hypothetical protein
MARARADNGPGATDQREAFRSPLSMLVCFRNRSDVPTAANGEKVPGTDLSIRSKLYADVATRSPHRLWKAALGVYPGCCNYFLRGSSAGLM